jgi:hypothetical protein
MEHFGTGGNSSAKRNDAAPIVFERYPTEAGIDRATNKRFSIKPRLSDDVAQMGRLVVYFPPAISFAHTCASLSGSGILYLGQHRSTIFTAVWIEIL